jgi:hypothetical protein
MNERLTVKKIADANYKPVKYKVVEMAVGTDAAGTNCVLETIEVGWATENSYNAYKEDRTITAADKVGTLGELTVDSLSNLEVYGEKVT